MKQGLEKFVNDHRADFDDATPPAHIWRAIDKEMNAAPKTKSVVISIKWLRWTAAAAIIIIVGTVLWLQPFSNQPKQPQSIAGNNNDSTQAPALPNEYAQQVYHFTQLIELKNAELKKIEKDQPELYKEFAADITRLDSSYQALQTQLPGNPNQEVLIQAMIENLQVQIDVLNKQLSIIQRIKQQKNGNDEKIYKTI
jgi:hypothetical protein